MPDLDPQPPGIDAETASEGWYPPRDHLVGADEIGVTAAEEAIPETVEERARRERPEGVAAADDLPGGRLVDMEGVGDDDGEVAGEWAEDGAGLSAEEAAIHITDA